MQILLSELIEHVKDHWSPPEGLPELGSHVITHPAKYTELYNILFGMILVYKKFGYEIIQDVEI